ncbi:MAG TPA: permease, partial [Pseudomonadales bacterium]|nr:permease [Pseudomonadales bacterium]
MDAWLSAWADAATTSIGLFWTAFWAFGLGYLISSMIQVFVTRARMRRSLGEPGLRSVGLATLFGFISSSCSFAALSGTRALFAKGAGLTSSLAFLLASTNLVIELGIIIAIFLAWQFVVAEYVGGVLLIGLMWLVVRLTYPRDIVEAGRERARAAGDDDGDQTDTPPGELIRSREGWGRVAGKYFMEWSMVWKDVTIGFTVAGIIAAFVPRSFFEALFPGTGTGDPGFLQLLAQTLIGPVAAFFTFIGSMGNIPLAAVLYGNGVAFAGIIAFIFSDLVVFPVLRIQARYYGWPLALYILGVFLVVLVTTALLMHYAFDLAGWLPDPESARAVVDRDFFAMNYTAVLNLLFLAMSGVFL